jgi:hypothetical protein
MRAVTIAVAMTACTSPYSDELAQRYESAKFCPSDRVHVGLAPELGLELVRMTAAPSDPWREPALPDDVAADPARLALWRTQRDAAFHAWQAQQRANDPVTGRVAENERRIPIYAATGCHGTALYACHAYRHSVGCDQITDAFAHERLVCRDGRTVRAIGDTIGCVDGPPVRDPYTCTAACTTADVCERACRDVNCRLACATAEVGCRFDCVETARAGCVAAGLDRFGLCASIATQATMLGDAQRSIATTAAAVRARLPR